MPIRVITPPAVEPLTLEEVKADLKVEDSDSDAYLTRAIKSAREYLENKARRALVTQTQELVLDGFPADEIQLPVGSLQSVESIKYDDENGDEQTLATDQYTVDNASDPGWIVANENGWPNTIDAVNSVRVRFIAGYPPDEASPPDLTANIPEVFKQAIIVLLDNWNDKRDMGVSADLEKAITRLIFKHINFI
jgi:uncharacterized phiE125 gp8 family phage protein